MDERESKNRIPCVIEAGVLTSPRDMQRVLRDLGHVRYVELVDDVVQREGEGYVMSVVSHPSNATVVAHKRLYLNVNGFDYLKLVPVSDSVTAFDLVIDAYRTLRLLPQTDPLAECLDEGPGSDAARLLDETLDSELYAEIYADDEDGAEG